MSKEIKVIPELRFPEFKNDGGWEKKKLGDIAENLDSKRIPITSNQREKGEIPYYGASGIIDFVKDYIYDEELLCISEDGANLVDRNYPIAFTIRGKTWVNNHAHVLKFENPSSHILVEKYINSINVEPFLTGAAQPKLNRGKLDIIPFLLPKNPQEQQKIASCLSSLDELLAAHKEKLDALKDHKKGLMQNLFPNRLNHDSKGLKDDHDFDAGKKSSNQANQKNQGSDNVPKVRFPEFEDDGAWIEKRLGKIGEPLMCKRIFKDQTTPNPENGIPFYKIGTFGKEPDAYIPVELYEEFKSKYNFPNKGDILISASGTIGRLVIYDDAPAYFQDSNIVWLGHDGKQVTNDFLYHCYSIVNWQTSDGGVIKRLYNSDLKAIPIKFPENEIEQQKIATCLSAVDELINAQADKIKQLQQHKKGLMQGLFPKIER